MNSTCLIFIECQPCAAFCGRTKISKTFVFQVAYNINRKHMTYTENYSRNKV